MAKYEADREDLIADATALVRRAELRTARFVDPVVAGFRRDGGLSVYFGADPVYHLDRAGRLKRAYRDGRLYRTQGNTLAELTRDRGGPATVLLRRDLSAEECEAFLAEMQRTLSTLAAKLESGEAEVTRQVPVDDRAFEADLTAAVAAALPSHGGLALAPRFRGKR